MSDQTFAGGTGFTGGDGFEPRIVGFFCNWCSYRAADLAGSARLEHATNIRIIRLMCSGRVDPAFVLKALAMGADGVLIAGCHPGECHYIEQNHKAMRRVKLIKKTVAALGSDPERVRLLWASAAEGPQLAAGIDEMVAAIRDLGPLNWPGRRQRSVADVVAFEQLEKAHHAAAEIEQSVEVAP